jgi:hypothetical protein
MKQILFLLFVISFTSFGCSSVKKTDSGTIQQGLSGQITEATGNRMPMKDATPSLPKGFITTVFIYEPTDLSQVSRSGTEPVYTSIRTKRVASVQTDSLGNYSVALEPGSYSVFVKLGDRFYANQFDTDNRIALFTVEAGKITRANLSVSNKASF